MMIFIKKAFKKYKINILAQEFFIALLVFIVGIFIGITFLQKEIETQIVKESIGLGGILVYFIIATIIILMLLKATKGRLVFQLLFMTALFGGMQVTFSTFLGNYEASLLSLAIVIIRFVFPLVWTQNFAMILSLAGIGAIFGISISPWVALSVLFILAIYDFIAVFVTKHMVKMAKGLVNRGVFLAVVIPEKMSLWNTKLSQVQINKQFLILGGGDLALPLVLISSALTIGILASIITAFFSLMGIAVTHWIFVSQRIKRPIPALPPIALSGILGFIISLIIL